KNLLALILATTFSANLFAAPFVTINGKALDESDLNAKVTQIVGESKGRYKDSAALRQEIAVALVREELITQAAAKQNITPQAYMEAVIAKADVSDTALLALYDKKSADLAKTKNIALSVIVVKTEKEADAIQASLAKGKKWNDLVAKSIDTETKKKKGVVGVQNTSQMSPEIAQALLATPEGKVMPGRVQGANGWQIFKVDAITDPKALPFEQIKPLLAQELKTEAAMAEVKQLTEQATIVTPNATPAASK
ncbi:MAG: peptidyl-prolyl cis-trans isomerase, partial [Neisseriaceae bacterium]|nr:peptidyl-prolyl cis-trans isomerase [Neisseriaceae bacterium]